MPFTCSKCGICCKTVGILIEKSKQILQKDAIIAEICNFPHRYDANGRCEKLSLDNICTIYDTRPDMCNVEVFHKKYFSHVSQKEFFELNEQECIKLQRHDIS